MACKTFFRSLAVLPIFLLVQCAQDSKTFGEDDLKGFTGALSGQVLSRKGSPLSAVTVTVSPGGATTTTDGEGRYALDGISEGAHQVRFMKADYRDTLLGDSVRLGLNDSLEASAAMTYRYAAVYGAVVDKNGKPLPTAGVAVQAQSASALAMDEGKFTLRRVEPGRVKLFAAQAGVGYGIQEVTLSPEDSLDVSAIKLDREGGMVSGTVVDGTGLPVSGATVSAVGGVLKDVTGLDGKYELVTVPSESDVQLTVEYGGKNVGVALVQVGEGASETLPVISIGSGLGVDLIAMLPSTQLVPVGASSVSLLAQAVWDETDERNTPYWYNETFGVLYNWPAAVSVCPVGWHLPTDDEWTILTTYVDANNDNKGVGNSLKSAASLWPTSSGIVNSDDFYFSALPGGNYGNTVFSHLTYADFWTSTANGETAFDRYVEAAGADAYKGDYAKTYGLSVRCIKD